jgi:hypothetical protein
MTTAEAKDIKTRILESLLKSGITSVILTLLLLWIMGFVKDVLVVEVPKHLAIIQAGYEKISKDNIEANKAIATQHTEIAKLLSERFDLSVQKLETKLDRLIQENKASAENK